MDIVTSKEQIPAEQLQGGGVTATNSGVLSSSGIETMTVSGMLSPIQPEMIAYTITDPIFGTFAPRKSANAWWMDRARVVKLISAFKNNFTIVEARVYAGISREQWNYFVEVHPEFYDVKKACEAVLPMQAMGTINANLHDVETAKWYVKNVARRIQHMEEEKKVEPVQVNVQTNIINNERVDEQKVATIVARLTGKRTVAVREGVYDSETDNNRGVAE